jgi:hypothetical protein
MHNDCSDPAAGIPAGTGFESWHCVVGEGFPCAHALPKVTGGGVGTIPVGMALPILPLPVVSVSGISGRHSYKSYGVSFGALDGCGEQSGCRTEHNGVLHGNR